MSLVAEVNTSTFSKVKVKILDKEYVLKGEVDPSYMQEVALFVDKRIRDLQRSLNSMSMDKVILLAFLNLADDHLQLRVASNDNTHEGEADLISQKTAYLINLLEENIIGK